MIPLNSRLRKSIAHSRHIIKTFVMPCPSLYSKSPRDLKWVMLYMLLESYTLFNLFSVLMWILLDECGFSDWQAGFVYGAFSLAVSIFGVIMGPVVDKLMVRRSMILQCVLAVAGCVMMSISLHPAVVCVALFVFFAPALSIIHTAVSIAQMRYTTPTYRSQAFAVHYVVMNLSSVASLFTVDAFRLWIPRDALLMPLWSMFLACNGAIHIISLLIVYVGVRDIEVSAPEDGEDEDEAVIIYNEPWDIHPCRVSATQYRSARELYYKVRDTMKQSLFWRYVLVTISLVGARSVLVYLFTLYPVYMRRAPFPVADPAKVPFMMYTLLDPVIVIVLSWIVAIVVQRMQFPVYWVIVVGTVVGAAAPFWMMVTEYWAVFGFIITMAVAESIWSPLYMSYQTYFTTKGDEGIFFGLTGMTTTAAKMTTSIASGFLLHRFCPAYEDCTQGHWIWFIAGFMSLTTPILLIVLMRWTWLKDSDKATPAAKESESVDCEEDNAFSLEQVVHDINSDL